MQVTVCELEEDPQNERSGSSCMFGLCCFGGHKRRAVELLTPQKPMTL